MGMGQRRDARLKNWGRSLAVAAAAALAVAGANVAGAAADEKADAKADAKAEEKITYVKHIQPILKESCVGCHKAPAANARGGGPGAPGARRGPGAPGGGAGGGGGGGGGGPGGGPRGPAGGLRLDDKAMILKGGKHGKAVVPGKGEESLLYRVLKEPVKIGDDEIHAMPKAKPGQEFTAINDDEIELVKKWIDQGAK